MTLTILTWFWTQPGGRSQYEPYHVAIWADMVRRHLSLPHRLACVTDEAIDLPSHIDIIRPPKDFEDVRIPTWPEARPQCLRRLSMFKPDAAGIFGDWFVCMDLDCVIGEDIAPLFSGGETFRICTGTAEGRPYNGSMMMLKAGARPKVFTKFTPAGAVKAGRKYVGSDQAWIAHILPGERTWGADDGVSFFGLPRHPEVPRRIMFFAGSVKPWQRAHHGWIGEHYRREPQGRCLILGYEGDVWGDAARALKGPPFQGVIASPEAAEHWPGRITAVAGDNREARVLAAMHGFEETVWCGRSEEEV